MTHLLPAGKIDLLLLEHLGVKLDLRAALLRSNDDSSDRLSHGLASTLRLDDEGDGGVHAALHRRQGGDVSVETGSNGTQSSRAGQRMSHKQRHKDESELWQEPQS